MNCEPVELKSPSVASHLGEVASYIDSQLSGELCRRFGSGRFFALAPIGTEEPRLLEFKRGGLTPPGPATHQGEYRLTQVINLDDEFANILQTSLKKWSSSAAVGFDSLSSVRINNKIDLSKEPFGVLDIQNPTASDVESFVRSFSTAWQTVAMIVDRPTEVSSASQFADSMRLFAVSAYDGESYLYWMQS